jgi:glycerate kinase
MNILIAVDKFKDTLSADEVSKAIEEGIRKIDSKINIETISVSDGGENFAETLAKLSNATEFSIEVNNPINKKINANYYIDKNENTAFINLSSASGLQLLEIKERNPMKTSTFGTGEIIKNAILKGAKKIIIGAGGSATNDCGVGAASALGFVFKDKKNNVLLPEGKSLRKIKSIDTKNVLKDIFDTEFIIATDVTNHLHGKKGAAFSFAKQKGASFFEILILNKGLKNIANIIENQFKKNIRNIKGSGAAGGFGGGVSAFLNAEIVSGTKLIFEKINLEEKIKNADLIITGEGKFDKQTFNGKIVSAITNLANKHSKKTVVICGFSDISEKKAKKLGVYKIISLYTKKVNLEKAKIESYKFLVNVASTFISNFEYKN